MVDLYPNILSIDEAINNRFKLVIKNFKIFNNLRDFEFYFQSVTIPGISGESQQIGAPQNFFSFPGNKLTYDQKQVTFKVDEDLNTYFEIFQWMKKIYSPEDFKKQFESYQQNPREYDYTVDASLFSLTQEYNPNIEFKFYNIYPVALSGLDLTLRMEDILRAQVTFKYDYFDIVKSETNPP